MEFSRESQNQLSTLSGGHSKKMAIKLALAKLAIRRQAKIAEAEFEIFTEDLISFEMRDIESAMVSLSSRPRGEGETAFPEAAAIVAEVTKAGRNRRIAEDRERRKADEAREAHRQRTHPEEFEPIGPNDLKAMAEKLPNFDYEKPKDKPVYVPKIEACPQCSFPHPTASNMRFWSADEILAYGNTVKELERQSALNREANKVWQEKCIAEQLANLPSTPVPSVGEFDEVPQ